MAASVEPKTDKTTVLETDFTTTNSRPPTPATHSEEMYYLYKDGLAIYILRQTFQPEIEQETEN